ncbi:MAG: contractile injection system tape measure protein [Agriterribacter sp.]
MNNVNHIIERQCIAINFEDPSLHIGIQNRVAELFYTRLQPRMENLFNEIADDDHIAVIDKLEIDCGHLPAKHWEDEWVDCTIRKLKEQLNVISKKKMAAADIQADFFYFLQQGQLPWNSRVKSLKTFEQSIVMDHVFLEALKNIFPENNVVERLTRRFSAGFITKLIYALTENEIQYEPGKAGTFNVANLQLITGQLSTRQMEVHLKNLAKAIAPGKKNNSKPATDKTSTPVPPNPYIGNAGIILLHPFLPALFEALHLTIQQQWVNEDAQHRAVLITAYIASGREDLPEFELALNKLICGLDIPDTLRQIPEAITVETVSACEEMITAAIQHWTALKNTGIEAFRETFLQRDGKITSVDKGWLLQVEQKGVDVLLNSLPWGIGVVKLPWMKAPIYTEWNS